jgi:hypothetical protein
VSLHSALSFSISAELAAEIVSNANLRKGCEYRNHCQTRHRGNMHHQVVEFERANLLVPA